MRTALLALVALARATPPPRSAATMLRLNTDKENLNIANRSLEFVKIIREDLRRNNDDYVAAGGGRRHPIDTRRNLNATNNETTARSSSQNATIFRSYSHPMRHYKKLRVKKIKRLIDKGKREREVGRVPAGGAALPPHMNVAKGAIRADIVNSETGQNAVNGENGASTGAGAGENQATEGKAALRQLAAPGSPSPDQLDMAPARGPQIQVIRFKGRLCQRSVLNMEGPLYDAHGASVAPRYRPELGRGRQFPNTRAPDMILPRCCNCCKKSVLGCQ